MGFLFVFVCAYLQSTPHTVTAPPKSHPESLLFYLYCIHKIQVSAKAQHNGRERKHFRRYKMEKSNITAPQTHIDITHAQTAGNVSSARKETSDNKSNMRTLNSFEYTLGALSALQS